MINPKALDDKTKIKILKGVVLVGAANQIAWLALTRKMTKQFETSVKFAKLNNLVVNSFVEHCKDHPDILQAVLNDVEFDAIVVDL